MRKLQWTLPLLALAALLPATALGDIFSEGHGDIGFGYHDGELHPHVHLHGGGEFEPDEITILVPGTVYTDDVEDGLSAFREIPQSLGLAAGAKFWNLYANGELADETKSPYLGLSAEEIPDDVLVDDQITIELTDFSGPGEFTLWASSGIEMQTYDDGEGGQDFLLTDMPLTHLHYNWAFSEEGDYFLTLEATGVLEDGGGLVSGSGTFHFRVVPEPSTFALTVLGLGGLGLVSFVRRRRAAQC
jgi:surface-anchored protein